MPGGLKSPCEEYAYFRCNAVIWEGLACTQAQLFFGKSLDIKLCSIASIEVLCIEQVCRHRLYHDSESLGLMLPLAGLRNLAAVALTCGRVSDPQKVRSNGGVRLRWVPTLLDV